MILSAPADPSGDREWSKGGRTYTDWVGRLASLPTVIAQSVYVSGSVGRLQTPSRWKIAADWSLTCQTFWAANRPIQSQSVDVRQSADSRRPIAHLPTYFRPTVYR